MAPFIAFDLDGTLISCAERQLALLEFALTELSLPAVSLVEVWNLKRQGHSTRAALLQSGLPPSAASAAAALWQRHIEELPWLTRDRLLESSLEALSLCEERGYPLALLTARAEPENLHQQLTWLGLSPHFKAVRVFSHENVAAQKAACLRELGAWGFIGDTESDADAASLAEVPFVAVASGQRSPEFLRSKGINAVVADACEAARRLLARAPA